MNLQSNLIICLNNPSSEALVDSKNIIEKTVNIVSLGCPKNLVDTENMINDLESRGYKIIPDADKAEIILVNTCSFVTDARKESIDTLLDLSRYKEEGKAKLLVGTGCLVSRYKDTLPSLLPEVDMMLSTFEESRLGELLDGFSRPNFKSTNNAELIIPQSIPFREKRLTPRHRAYVKISEGCDHTCTFCSIPLSRGAQISRQPEDILSEITRLGNEGVEEITLIAQDLTRYGSDLGLKDGLAELLLMIDGLNKVAWVRLLYAYPTLVTDRLLDVIRESPSVVKYLDIPLQHVNGEVLRRMERPGNVESSRRLVSRIREKVPGISLRTTFIVGFPGETDEEFQELMSFVKWANFDHLGVFSFSREEGTPSYDMDGQIPARIKNQRRNQLMALQKKISFEKNKSYVGKVLPILIEGPSEQSPLVLSGRIATMAPDSIDGEVLVLSGSASVGEIVECRITKAHPYDLEAWEISVPPIG
ncbi:MAG: 30S ribosomal protein S12 methylthiotransferase RimO [Leptospirillum sp.]|jgi:ribosomal protein S12 methylthiotransferase